MRLKALPRWGAGIVGSAEPDAGLQLTLNGITISRTEIHHRTITLEEETFDMLGVGALWTASEYRRRGFASSILQSVRTLAEKEGKAGVILFSLESAIPFYKNRGLELHHGPVFVLQPRGSENELVQIPTGVALLLDFQPMRYFNADAQLEIGGLPW